MKIKSLILSLLILFTVSLTVEASQIPKQVRDYLVAQKKVPTIRFDGVVSYGADVMYLPVYPSYTTDVDSVKVVKTYPENQTIDKLPDMILFNNNFALLKVIKIDDNTLSVRNIPDLPIQIKTGLLPQDIMVPRGLVLPENLAGILGDVHIPLVGSAKSGTFVTRKTAPLPTGKRIVDTKHHNVPSALKDKLFFVNNFQTEYLQVFSSTVSEPLYSLKTSGVMKDIKSVMDGKYILAATSNKKNIDVIDVTNEYIAKNIDLTAIPSEIVVDEINKKAYVASINDESLSVIDLTTMTMKEKIQLVGSPQRLALSSDSKFLAYSDMKTSNIYILDLENNYENKLITKLPNVTKLILKDNVLYLIARTSPELRVVYYDLLQDNKTTKTKEQRKKEKAKKDEGKADLDTLTDDLVVDYDLHDDGEGDSLVLNSKTYSTSIKDVKVGVKPVDMYEKNGKIFILCAGDNSVYTYDVSKDTVGVEKLPVDGFSKAFTPISNSNYAVITNMSDYKYVVYDMEKNKAVQTFPINDYVNMITILDRVNE
ncbi:MAG: hypothetical protein E7Z90_06100 [Cyanobacteria bacterium SIG29]|nr:hypothetical protein [Cyanobacteria bacterium SIG29]